jgi:hypothetical protein
VNVIPLEHDDWTEAVDADIPRADLVGKAANGSPGFLLMKSDAAGILSPDEVRTLITKAEETPVTAPVAKADTFEAANAVLMDDEPLADAESLNADATEGADGAGVPTEAPGDPDDPKSAAWEAVDAARARQALQLTVALKRLVEQAQDRETQESAVTGDEDDFDNSWTLTDVLSCLDEVLGLLAPFAITEQAEADQMTAEVMKAGRTLSAANEKAIRGAADALQNVLATLPAATTDDGQPVAKETTVTEPAPVTTEPADVEKAKGDPMTPVYDANGKLVGMMTPADLVPITPAEDATADADEPADEPAPDATEAPAADAATIPGTDTVQAPVQKNEDVTKAAADQFAAALGEALTPLAKQLEQYGELAGVVKGLQESVEKMSREPDDRRSPLVSGGTGMAGIAKRDGSTTDADELTQLRKQQAEATDPAEKQRLSYAIVKARFQQ